jgi:hypothetical protein
MAKQTIAIAGAERKMGSLVTRNLLRLGRYRLLILTEGAESVSLPQEWRMLNPGAEPEIVDCLKDGCWEADMIVLDIPVSSIQEAADKIREVSTQKIIFVIPGDPQETADPVEVWRSLLPNAKTVVALNLLNSTATLLSGPDEESLDSIGAIAGSLGFETIIQSKN